MITLVHSIIMKPCSLTCPGVLQCHYKWITPIVKQTCAEFDIKYNGTDSFRDALSLHFTYLKKMGSGAQHLHHHDNQESGDTVADKDSQRG